MGSSNFNKRYIVIVGFILSNNFVFVRDRFSIKLWFEFVCCRDYVFIIAVH